MSLVQDWEKVKDCENGVALYFSRLSSMIKVAVDTGEGELSQEVGPFDVKGIDDVAERLRVGHVRFDPNATIMIRNAAASLSMAAALRLDF